MTKSDEEIQKKKYRNLVDMAQKEPGKDDLPWNLDVSVMKSLLSLQDSVYYKHRIQDHLATAFIATNQYMQGKWSYLFGDTVLYDLHREFTKKNRLCTLVDWCKTRGKAHIKKIYITMYDL